MLGDPMSSTDGVLRAVTHDGSFRVIAVQTTDTVLGAIAAQKAGPAIAARFAELLTAAVLVRESMAPDYRLQCVLQGDDQRSRMVADTHPDGMTRGLVQLAGDASDFTIAQRGVLQVHRTLQNGSLHQGIVGVPSGGGIAQAFMAYMQESEQVMSMMSVGCHMVDGQVKAAGGYLVQLLPELAQDQLAIMTERLEDFRDIVPLLARGEASPRTLLFETLYGMPYDETAEREVRFGCNCSTERLTASLASLPRNEIEEFVRDGQMLDISCDFCAQDYRINPENLRGLLDSN